MNTLILIRGLPGSGKSSLAETLGGAYVFAADDFFVSNGEYKFNPKHLALAHATCQDRVRGALRAFPAGERPFVTVVVTNTFVEAWELEPYRLIAQDRDARLVIVSLFDGGGGDAELAARNVHGVPVTTIAAMRGRFDHTLTGDLRPPWERGAKNTT